MSNIFSSSSHFSFDGIKTLLQPGSVLWVSSQLSQKSSTHHQDHRSGLGLTSPEPGGTVSSSSLDPVLLLMGPDVFANLVSQDFFTRAASLLPTCFLLSGVFGPWDFTFIPVQFNFVSIGLRH